MPKPEGMSQKDWEDYMFAKYGIMSPRIVDEQCAKLAAQKEARNAPK